MPLSFILLTAVQGLGGLETYEIKNGSKKAVLFVYDIYGYSAQIKQGEPCPSPPWEPVLWTFTHTPSV